MCFMCVETEALGCLFPTMRVIACNHLNNMDDPSEVHACKGPIYMSICIFPRQSLNPLFYSQLASSESKLSDYLGKF